MIHLSLLGGGGHASDVLTVIEARVEAGLAHFTTVIADDLWIRPERFDGRGELKLLESIEAGAQAAPFIAAVGYPATRRAIYDRAIAVGGTSASHLLHPGADIGASVLLAAGVVVMGQVWVSSGVEIGEHAHVSYGSTIGHDTRIGSFSSLMPGACLGGDVDVAEGSLIGANATILQGLSIGVGAIVGAGAVVTRDVAPGTTVVGCPARPVEELDQ